MGVIKDDKPELFNVVSAIETYYKGKEKAGERIEKILITGIGDARGTLPSNPFGRGLLKTVADRLTFNGIDTQVIDANSSLYSDSKHINTIFRDNLSLRELELIKTESIVSDMKQAIYESGCPLIVRKVCGLYRIVGHFKKRAEMGNSYIRKVIKDQNCKPIVIYSSGAGDIERALGTTPSSLESDYRNREYSQRYEYAFDVASREDCIKGTIEATRNNFDLLSKLNNHISVFALGLRTPVSFRGEERKPFGNLIARFNEELKKVCSDYNVSFVDVEKLARECFVNGNSFHLSSIGNAEVMEIIIRDLYMKLKEQSNYGPDDSGDRPLGLDGLMEILKNERNELSDVLNLGSKTSEDIDYRLSYPGQVVERRLAEIDRKKAIAKKVLRKENNV